MIATGQVLVQACDYLSPIADRRCDALYRTRADIADCKDACATRFERLPPEFSTRDHKSLAIESDVRARQPGAVRISADKQEQVMDGTLHFEPSKGDRFSTSRRRYRAPVATTTERARTLSSSARRRTNIPERESPGL